MQQKCALLNALRVNFALLSLLVLRRLRRKTSSLQAFTFIYFEAFASNKQQPKNEKEVIIDNQRSQHKGGGKKANLDQHPESPPEYDWNEPRYDVANLDNCETVSASECQDSSSNVEETISSYDTEKFRPSKEVPDWSKVDQFNNQLRGQLSTLKTQLSKNAFVSLMERLTLMVCMGLL